MKKTLMIAIIVIIVIIMSIVLIYLRLYIIGEPRCEGLHIDSISVSDNLITLKGGTESSAEAYKEFEYDIINDSLYIKIKYVVIASDFYRSGNFTINMESDLSQIDKIYITDGNNDRLIWSKQEI